MPAAHGRSHAPQWSGSVETSTQVRAQHSSPAGQPPGQAPLGTHQPPEQSRPGAQAAPHAPQFSRVSQVVARAIAADEVAHAAARIGQTQAVLADLAGRASGAARPAVLRVELQVGAAAGAAGRPRGTRSAGIAGAGRVGDVAAAFGVLAHRVAPRVVGAVAVGAGRDHGYQTTQQRRPPPRFPRSPSTVAWPQNPACQTHGPAAPTFASRCSGRSDHERRRRSPCGSPRPARPCTPAAAGRPAQRLRVDPRRGVDTPTTSAPR